MATASQDNGESIIKLYARQFKCHAVVCEAVTCLLECIAGAAVAASLSIVHAIISCATSDGHERKQLAKFQMRECVIYLACALSFCCPGLILRVYRHFDPYDSWNLAPLPTILGNVDPRRFATVRRGGGQDADNVHTRGYTLDNCPCLAGLEIQTDLTMAAGPGGVFAATEAHQVQLSESEGDSEYPSDEERPTPPTRTLRHRVGSAHSAGDAAGPPPRDGAPQTRGFNAELRQPAGKLRSGSSGSETGRLLQGRGDDLWDISWEPNDDI